MKTENKSAVTEALEMIELNLKQFPNAFLALNGTWGECIKALEKQIPKKPITQFEKLKQMNTDEAAAFISALADSCKDVARYGNQTIPYLVKLLLECEVEEE